MANGGMPVHLKFLTRFISETLEKFNFDSHIFTLLDHRRLS